jgi:hypothetical protein
MGGEITARQTPRAYDDVRHLHDLSCQIVKAKDFLHFPLKGHKKDDIKGLRRHKVSGS